jgi:hypothetical protein
MTNIGVLILAQIAKIFVHRAGIEIKLAHHVQAARDHMIESGRYFTLIAYYSTVLDSLSIYLDLAQ